MRIPKPPFESTEKNLLYGLIMGGDCIGFEQLQVSSDVVPVSLTVPITARYAVVVLEADNSTSDKNKVVRFLETKIPEGSADLISASYGMPLGDMGVYEVKDTENLKNFRVLSIESGKTHVLQVQYFA